MNEPERTIELRERTGDTIRATARFGPRYIGFQGHFSGEPILPGFAQVQLVVDVLQMALGQALTLREVVAAKFSSAIGPGDAVGVEITRKGEGVYACVLMVGGGLASALELGVEASG